MAKTKDDPKERKALRLCSDMADRNERMQEAWDLMLDVLGNRCELSEDEDDLLWSLLVKVHS